MIATITAECLNDLREAKKERQIHEEALLNLLEKTCT
jgi:hypothetical protein